MTRRNWRRIHPTSIRHAIELCLEHGRERRRLSVDRVADLMGLQSRWVIYKWAESGRIPATMIRPLEHACGATYITQYLATSAHKLLIDIPTGASASQDDLLELQAACGEAVALLARHYRGEAEADEVVSAITSIMEDLAGHREAVVKSAAPELGLWGEDEEA